MLPSSLHHAGSLQDLMEPAIQGPPSPESLRAINNQMRLASSPASSPASDNSASRQSHQTTSSGSSSLRSMTSSADRPSWDLTAMDATAASTSTSASSLSRKSSGRSTISTQPRDSVQFFGKSIFGKRPRVRRESSAQSSSSSIYSADAPASLSASLSASAPAPAPVQRTAMEVPTFMAPGAPFITSASYARSNPASAPATSRSTKPPGSRDSSSSSFMPFFSRRRASTRTDTIDEESAKSQKKLLISGPFNFQHLTMPMPNDDPETASIQSSHPSVDGSSSSSSFFPSFPAESLTGAVAVSDDVVLATLPRRSPMRPHASSLSAAYPPMRTLTPSRSQDQLRMTSPPPRPPRSPVDLSHAPFSPPIPPPRMSSRLSLRSGDLDMSVRTTVDRPRTSGGFRQPSPFSFATPTPNVHRAKHAYSHSHSHASSFSADLGMAPLDMRRFSQTPDRSVTSVPSMPSMPSVPPMPSMPPAAPHDDSNWPLASPPAASPPASATSAFCMLPGVPEEEEFIPRNNMRRSRMSTASIASSLRKSHSLPLLQQFPQPPPTSPQSSQSPQSAAAARPPSAASDTLGTLAYAAPQSLRDLVQGGSSHSEGEAEAEAEWDVLEASWEDDIDYCYEHEIEADCEYAWERPSLDLSRDEALAGLEEGSALGSSSSSRSMPALSRALSPASDASTASLGEATTPTTTAGTGFAMRRNPGLTIKTGALSDADAEAETEAEADAGEERPVNKFLHARSSPRGARASLFLEAQGFDLSPSLFIPGSDKYDRFRPPMRGSPVGFAFGGDDDEEHHHHHHHHHDNGMGDLMPPYLDPATMMAMDKAMRYMPTRTSASTTGSGASRDSVVSSQTSSTATDLTRLTMSTMSSSSMEDLEFKDASANRESMIIPPTLSY